MPFEIQGHLSVRHVVPPEGHWHVVRLDAGQQGHEEDLRIHVSVCKYICIYTYIYIYIYT